MVTLDVTTNAGEIAVQYGEATKLIAAHALKTMRAVEREVIKTLKASIRNSIGRYSGRLLNKTRGRLKIDETTHGITLKVKSLQWYAPGHEHGAVRTPTRGAHMTVPMWGAANDQRGSMVRWGDGTRKTSAFSARDVIAAPGRYGFSGTFTRDGIIFGRLLDHDEILPLFMLKRSVPQRARWMHRSAREVVAPIVSGMLGISVGEALEALTHGGVSVGGAPRAMPSGTSVDGMISELRSLVG